MANFCEILAFVLVFSHASFGELGEDDPCTQCIRQVTELKTHLSSLPSHKLQELVAHQSVRQLCISIGQCEENAHAGQRSVFTAEIQMVENNITGETGRGTALCRICRVAMTFIHNIISNPHWQKVILNTLKLACHYVPLFSHTCSILVDQYGSLILRLMANYLQPGMCHSLLHVCPKATESIAKWNDCHACEFGVGILYDTINDPALDDRIALLKENVCGSMYNADKQCLEAADQMAAFVKEIVAELHDSSKLKSFCQDQSICPSGRLGPFDN